MVTKPFLCFNGVLIEKGVIMKRKCKFLKKAARYLDVCPAGNLLLVLDFNAGEIRLKSTISHCALCEHKLNDEDAAYPLAGKFVCASCKAGITAAKALSEY